MIGWYSMFPEKIWLTIAVFLFFTLPIFGQSSIETPAPEATEIVEVIVIERGVLEVESAFVRQLPIRESEAVASVFERDVLEIIGRNIDGL